VCVCVPHNSLSDLKVGSNESNSVPVAISSHSLGPYQLTSPVLATVECIPFVLVTHTFCLRFAAKDLFQY
jgi:hypothetical protein